MRDDLTLVYITSNRENEYFESKIIETMKESINGLPVVSVSQKPIDFGENICLGDIGAKEEAGGNPAAAAKTGVDLQHTRQPRQGKENPDRRVESAQKNAY